MFYHETMGTMADESKLYKTFSFRVKDSTSGKKLVRLGTKVKFRLELLQRRQQAVGAARRAVGRQETTD